VLSAWIGVSAWLVVAAVGADEPQRALTVEGRSDASSSAALTPGAGRVWVFAVGVDHYERVPSLSFCGRDAAGLIDVFRKRFEVPPQNVIVIHDRADRDHQPRKATVEAALREFTAHRDRIKAEDLLVFAFSGHGVAIKDVSYLCPTEADIRRPEQTMIRVDWVYKQLFQAPAGRKLLLIDACRNVVDPDDVQTRAVDARIDAARKDFDSATREFRSTVRPPEDQNIVLLRSCGEEQVSIEDAVAEHGLFMRYVLQALEGDDTRVDQSISASRLFSYAARLTQDDAAKRFRRVQKPSMLITGDVLLPLPTIGPGKNNDYENSIGIRFSLIEPGAFLRGAPHSDRDAAEEELPQHRVRLTRPLLLSRHEVTRKQYHDVMGGDAGEEARLPIDNVSWYDAVEFCNRLSQLERLTPYYEFDGQTVTCHGGTAYRLPTEAEWEYAARAGRSTRWHFGDDPAQADGYAWHAGNSEGKLHPVGTREANAWGLFDVHGNVWEWCWDYFRPYADAPQTDPQGPATGGLRVVHGGAATEPVTALRASNRLGYGPGIRTAGIGFRVARTYEAQH
jgi:formylglycine-generating enzyme required for sulfatase activity